VNGKDQPNTITETQLLSAVGNIQSDNLPYSTRSISLQCGLRPNEPDPMILDAPITALAKAQAQQAQSEVKQLDLINVIVSPFTRTLQTAHFIFGNRLPFQINSGVREQLCNSCDVGSPPHDLAKD
jgi:hypothetical protein